MANDYLKITPANRPQMAAQVIRQANMLLELRNLADANNDMASHMHDGATYATVETNFGLPPGTGGNFVTMLQQVQDILNTNTTVAGQTRLDNLDAFVARIAGQ